MHLLCFAFILAAPVIEVESKFETVKVKAGALVLLAANVTGLPQPSMNWKHNGRPLQKADNVNVETNIDVTNVSIKGSSAKNGGKYELVAANEVGEATAVFTVIVTDRPDAPQNLKVTEVSKDYVILTWEAPENDGGSDITGYTIEKRDAAKTHWGQSGTASANEYSFKVRKLFEGSEYLFRVAAENKIGLSDFAELKEPVKARLPFGE